MPIPAPNLDDRSFQDLVDETLARIPAHTPEWTNPVVGDPGRTLIELFAFLGDALLYRINLIPDRQKLAFLRLLGLRMRPATAARTLVALSIDTPGNTRAVALPALTPVKNSSPFETGFEVTVLPVAVAAYCKRPLTDKENAAAQKKLGELRSLYSVGADQDAVPYFTTPVFAGGRPERPAPFDLIGGTVDQALWFALLSPEGTTDPDALRTTLGQSESGGPQYLSVGISPADAVQTFDADAGARPPIPYVFELTAPDPLDPTGVVYRPLTVAADRTAGLTTAGVIRLVLPGKDSFFAPGSDVRKNPSAGTEDRPPRLDDPKIAARILAWLRLRPVETLGSLPLAWAGINAVEVEQRQTSAGIIIGQGTGQPDAAAQTAVGNLEAETFRLQVEESGRGFVRWEGIDDLTAAPPQARVYTLDPESGAVGFGDGVRGKIPEIGARVRVERMRVGGGVAGNVAAGTLSTLSSATSPEVRLKAWQPLPALGGQDAETIDEALERIPAVFRHRDRAVTDDDFRQLARATPGVRVGRVEVLPRFKPQQRRSNVPGVVSVMALPARTGLEAPYPNVDRPFREAVFNYLDQRKPLGTELYVIGCEYVQLGLTVGIDNPGGREEVNTAVKEALQGYLFALPPYGPHGGGWPLGRTVKRREMEVVVSRVEGVEGVSGPNLFVLVNGVWTRLTTPGGAETAAIPLQPWQLPELVSVVVVSGEAPTEFKPPTPKTARSGIAIPVVPEVC